MERGSEFTGLTRCQVEALLECFDFLRNGYVQIIDFCVENQWIIKMRHAKNGNWMVINIKPNEYRINKNGKCQKSVMLRESPERYSLFVNSDMSVGVVKTKPGAAFKFIPGSLSTNKDAR